MEQRDHDLLIEVSTTQKLMLEEMRGLRDGTKADIAKLQTDVQHLANENIALANTQKDHEKRILAIEGGLKNKNVMVETDRKYWTRRVLEVGLPLGLSIIWFFAALVLSKLHILNLTN